MGQNSTRSGSTPTHAAMPKCFAAQLIVYGCNSIHATQQQCQHLTLTCKQPTPSGSCSTAQEKDGKKFMRKIKKEHHRSQQLLLLTDLNPETNPKKRN